jgi:hypothetical protein
MNNKIFAAFALATSVACNFHSVAHAADAPHAAIFTDSYFESQKIAPITYKNLVVAHLSARYRANATNDKNFSTELENFLGYTMPDFNRVYHARKLSGMRTESESDDSIIAKYRPQVMGASPTSEVYLDVTLAVKIVSQGRLVNEYDVNANGLGATFDIDAYPIESGAQFANDDHATRITFNPAKYKITVPYAKADFQRAVYDAVSNSRPLTKSYRARLVLKITGCERNQQSGFRGAVVCTPELTSYQLFDSVDVRADRLMKTATIRLER